MQALIIITIEYNNKEEVTMTRINTVKPSMLSKQHLIAEYKEITRPFNKVKKHIEKGNKPSDLNIPSSYCLGKGHETFFFDKLEWLYKRYMLLCEEMLYREINVDLNKFNDICDDFFHTFYGTEWFNNWEPQPEDHYLNMARLAKRSKMSHVLSELLSE